MRWHIQSTIKSKNPQDRQREIFQTILKNRSLESQSQIQEFLKPSHPNTFTPQNLDIPQNQIQKASQLIRQAKSHNHQGIIYGDYDADGITATAILWQTLHQYGLNVLPYIPDRRTEGYGLNINSLKKLQTQYPDLKLIITVDQGIVAHQAAKYLQSQNIHLIITDHHQPETTLPPADTIIHTTATSGSGVSWLFSHWLLKNLKPTQNQPPLELAAIGTIADLLPLLKINRSFAHHGLTHLRQTQIPGLKSLFQLASLDPESLESYHISFQIAPRLNAMGRLEHALDSLRLLCTQHPQRAQQLAKILESTNRQRQDLTEQAYQLALSQVDPQENLIFIDHQDFDEGIVGLIAGKLTDKYHRPSIVISKQDETSKASARSISNYNIIAALRNAEHLLDSVGGHPMAAGFSVQNHQLPLLKKHLQDHAHQSLAVQDLTPSLEIDCQLDPSDLTFKLYQKLTQLAPFGFGNPQPIFSTYDFTISHIRPVGKEGKHLKLHIADPSTNQSFSAIAFNFGHLANTLHPGNQVDIAYNLITNTWNNQTNLELKIKDIKPS